MRENNREIPGQGSIDYFENGLNAHIKITDFSKEGYIYTINRNGGLPTIKVLAADIYIMSEADLHEVMNEVDEINGDNTDWIYEPLYRRRKRAC